jgi:hypothetical protein
MSLRILACDKAEGKRSDEFCMKKKTFTFSSLKTRKKRRQEKAEVDEVVEGRVKKNVEES